MRCGDHERSRSPEALVRLRRCPWRRAASHAAGPGRGHGAERLARSGAHATKGWEEAPGERAAPSRAGRPRDEAGHGDGDARARGRTSWRDRRSRRPVASQGWESRLRPPARLETVQVRGVQGTVHPDLTSVVRSNEPQTEQHTGTASQVLKARFTKSKSSLSNLVASQKKSKK